jgi:peptidoglycan hydrolase-like protein with peptidoglycan-binding domain
MMGITEVIVQLCVVLTATVPAIAQSPSPAPPSASPENSAIANPTSRPLLRLGSESDDVVEVQAMLLLLGFYDGPISGRFGEQTEAAVTRFQQAANLTADGIVGASTWNRLLPSATRVNVPPPPAQSTAQPIAQPTAQPTAAPANPTVETSTPPTRPTQPTTPDTETSSPVNPTASPDHESIPYVEFPVLRRGMRGAAVLGLQERLSAIGVYDGPIDGIFGAQTEAAVIAAQRQLNLTQDGIVGSATWTAILDLNP